MSIGNNFRPTRTIQTGADAPSHCLLCVPSDSDDLADVAQGFLLSVDGALKLTTWGGETITFPSGTFTVKQQIALRIRKVFSTGTGATGIYLFW